MCSLLDDALRLFRTDNLYTLFNVKKTCSPSELKRAFYKKSLLYHPDRHATENKELATQQFQILSKSFSILNDPESRAVYDETGIVGESFSEKSFNDWVDYWSLIFPRVTTAAIEEYLKKYRDSEEELNDLVESYNKFEGDMDAIMESMILSSDSDEIRVVELINKLIKDGRIKAYEKFVDESPRKKARRHKRAQKELKDFEKEKTKSKKNENTLSSLAMAIEMNKERRLKESGMLMDRLTEKYCKPEKKRKSK